MLDLALAVGFPALLIDSDLKMKRLGKVHQFVQIIHRAAVDRAARFLGWLNRIQAVIGQQLHDDGHGFSFVRGALDEIIRKLMLHIEGTAFFEQPLLFHKLPSLFHLTFPCPIRCPDPDRIGTRGIAQDQRFMIGQEKPARSSHDSPKNLKRILILIQKTVIALVDKVIHGFSFI